MVADGVEQGWFAPGEEKIRTEDGCEVGGELVEVVGSFVVEDFLNNCGGGGKAAVEVDLLGGKVGLEDGGVPEAGGGGGGGG